MSVPTLFKTHEYRKVLYDLGPTAERTYKEQAAAAAWHVHGLMNREGWQPEADGQWELLQAHIRGDGPSGDSRIIATYVRPRRP